MASASSSDSKLNDSLMRFLAGAAAGGTDSFFTMPFDTIKTQMQLNRRLGASFATCVTQILRNDGVPGFYQGYAPFAIMAMGKASVRWGSFGVLMNVCDHAGVDRSKRPVFWNFTLGLGAGTCEALVWTAPNERLKVLRQKSAGLGVATIPYGQIYRENGITRLWIGATPTAMRSATNAGIRFAVAGYVKEFFRWASGTPEGKSLPMYATFLAGGTGGAISVVCNNPIDVVKSKMQAGFQGGMLSCFRFVVQERGLMGFTAGLSARVPQIFLSQAIQFCVADVLLAGVGK